MVVTNQLVYILQFTREYKMNKLLVLGVVLALVGCGGGSNRESNIGSSSTPVPKQPNAKKNPNSSPTKAKEECPSVKVLYASGGHRVIDGDTVEVTKDTGTVYKIRLLGIDAPESSQEYGVQSTESLEQCLGGRSDSGSIRVEWIEKDRYGRLIGKIISRNVDCNAYQVEVGSAWHYKAYAKNQSGYDRAVYNNLEVQSHNAGKGLWNNPNAVAPWDYRKGKQTGEYSNLYVSTNGLDSCGSIRDDIVRQDGSGSEPNPVQKPKSPGANPTSNICSYITRKTCTTISTCTEAKQQLACGNSGLDRDGDGTPCESLCH